MNIVDQDLEKSILAAAIRRPHFLDETGIRSELFTTPELIGLATSMLAHRTEGVDAGELELALREQHARQVDVCLEHGDALHTQRTGFSRGVARLRRLATSRLLLRCLDRARVALVDAELERATDILSDMMRGIDLGDVPGGTFGDAAQTYAEAMIAAEAAEAAAEKGDGARRAGIRCGLPPVDAALRKGGFRPGSLWVFGGRSGCRKSAMALVGAVAALDDGYEPTIISIEDSKITWGERIVLLEAAKRELGTATADLMRAAALATRLQGRIVYPIDGTPAAVMEEIRKAFAAGSDVVYVDYVQAIQFPADIRRGDRAIANFARQGHGIARRAGAVLALGSQLVTQKDKAHREPTYHDLRECKELFDAADVVTLTWKPFAAHDGIVRGRVRKVKWASSGQPFTLEIAEQGMVAGAAAGHFKAAEDAPSEFSDGDGDDENTAPEQRPIKFGRGL